jgi:hypothetical protein
LVVKRCAAALVLALVSCAHDGGKPASPPPNAMPPGHARLAAVMWPVAKAIIYCTRRIDDYARPVGVAGPCKRLEAGDPEPVSTISWATLGRFENSAPDAMPASVGGRCHLEITQGQRAPAATPALLTWVAPSGKTVLEAWTPSGADAVDTDAYTLEATFAPEGEWMAILHVAVGLGDGERIVKVPYAKMIRVPACE